MSDYFYCQKCGGTFDPSRTYCPNCDGAVVMEQQARIDELEAEVERLKKRIEIVSKAAPDTGTLRNMLRAMQSGEMTVSRGVELLDMWLAGNYTDEQLPPVRNELGEDEMPWDRIDKLAAQNNDMLTELNTAWQQIKTEQRLSFRDQVADLTRQRDDLLAAAQAMIDRWDTPLWKDVPSTAEYINAMRHAVAKVKP